jgi:hypothetical protein
MQVYDTEKMPWVRVVANARVGEVQCKAIREGEVLPGVGYASDCYHYVGGETVFTAPRHRHDFEQIRISMHGEQDFGLGQITEEGWIAYFPAGAYYGPERIDGASIFQVQWSDFWVSRAEHDRAFAELQQTGEFRDGKYHWVDQTGQPQTQDALNAIWEHVFDRKSEFPEPRYPQPILMNPEAFGWVKGPGVVSEAVLGRFTERDLTIRKVRWDSRGNYELPAERTYCLFTVRGDIDIDGATHGQHTVLWSDLGETSTVEGHEGTEALCIAFPTAELARSQNGH